MCVTRGPLRRAGRGLLIGQVFALLGAGGCGARTDIADERAQTLTPVSETPSRMEPRGSSAAQAGGASSTAQAGGGSIPGVVGGTPGVSSAVPPSSNAGGAMATPTAGTTSVATEPMMSAAAPDSTTSFAGAPTAATPTAATPTAEPPVAGMDIPPAIPIPDFVGSSCTSLAGASHDGILFERVQKVYTFGDSNTTACLDVAPYQVCLYGVAADAGSDYTDWGAGVGLQLVSGKDPAEVFDATALGIARLGFDLVGADGQLDVRLMATMVNDPEIPEALSNYEENPFIWGGNPAYDMSVDGEYDLFLETFAQPEWTTLEPSAGGAGAGESIDLRRLHSLQFQIVTRQEFSAEYAFCISNVRWLDENGATIPL